VLTFWDPKTANRFISVVTRKKWLYEGKAVGGEISKPQNIGLFGWNSTIFKRILIIKETVCQLFLHERVSFLVREISCHRKSKHPIRGGIEVHLEMDGVIHSLKETFSMVGQKGQKNTSRQPDKN